MVLSQVTDVLRQTADGGIHLTGAGFAVMMILWLGLFILLLMVLWRS